jgi:hypothetical protein
MVKYPIPDFWKRGYRCSDFEAICNDFNLPAKDAARICYLLAEYAELKRIEAELLV